MRHYFDEFVRPELDVSDHIRDDPNRRVAVFRCEIDCKICIERYPTLLMRLRKKLIKRSK